MAHAPRTAYRSRFGPSSSRAHYCDTANGEIPVWSGWPPRPSCLSPGDARSSGASSSSLSAGPGLEGFAVAVGSGYVAIVVAPDPRSPRVVSASRVFELRSEAVASLMADGRGVREIYAQQGPCDWEQVR
jgi:hypothetical protein